MKSALVISFILLSVAGFPQQAEIDSLADRLQQSRSTRAAGLHDTDRVNTLNMLAGKLRYANPDTAIVLSSEALSISKNIGWQLGTAKSHGGLATLYWVKGDYQKALKYYSITLKMYEDLLAQEGGPERYKKSIAIILGNTGNIYFNQADYPKALKYYFKALAMDEELSNSPDPHIARTAKHGVAIHLGNIGVIYKKQGDYSKALKYYSKALSMNEESNAKNSMAANLGNIGTIYDTQADYPKALEYYFKALKIHKDLGNKNGVTINLSNIGGVCYSQKDYVKALEYYFKAHAMAKERGDKYSIAGQLGNIGIIYIYIGEFEKADITLHEGLTLSKEIRAGEYLADVHKSLSFLYDTTARPSQAFEAYKLYIIYRDSLVNEENTKAQTRTEMKYEYEKAEMVKEQEEREAGRLEAEATSRRDNLQYSIILIALLVFGGLLAVIGRFSMPIRIAEGIIFFSFLILFEFLLVLADPFIEDWSGGAPGIKLLFNAGIAALIFPLHSLFEQKLKMRLAS